MASETATRSSPTAYQSGDDSDHNSLDLHEEKVVLMEVIDEEFVAKDRASDTQNVSSSRDVTSIAGDHSFSQRHLSHKSHDVQQDEERDERQKTTPDSFYGTDSSSNLDSPQHKAREAVESYQALDKVLSTTSECEQSTTSAAQQEVTDAVLDMETAENCQQINDKGKDIHAVPSDLTSKQFYMAEVEGSNLVSVVSVSAERNYEEVTGMSLEDSHNNVSSITANSDSQHPEETKSSENQCLTMWIAPTPRLVRQEPESVNDDQAISEAAELGEAFTDTPSSHAVSKSTTFEGQNVSQEWAQDAVGGQDTEKEVENIKDRDHREPESEEFEYMPGIPHAELLGKEMESLVHHNNPMAPEAVNATQLSSQEEREQQEAQECDKFDHRCGPVNVGDTVIVDARTWPGINRPGGPARVKRAQEGKYDVQYLLGGSEKDIERRFIHVTSFQSEHASRNRRGRTFFHEEFAGEYISKRRSQDFSFLDFAPPSKRHSSEHSQEIDDRNFEAEFDLPITVLMGEKARTRDPTKRRSTSSDKPEHRRSKKRQTTSLKERLSAHQPTRESSETENSASDSGLQVSASRRPSGKRQGHISDNSEPRDVLSISVSSGESESDMEFSGIPKVPYANLSHRTGNDKAPKRLRQAHSQSRKRLRQHSPLSSNSLGSSSSSNSGSEQSAEEEMADNNFIQPEDDAMAMPSDVKKITGVTLAKNRHELQQQLRFFQQQLTDCLKTFAKYRHEIEEQLIALDPGPVSEQLKAQIQEARDFHLNQIVRGSVDVIEAILRKLNTKYDWQDEIAELQHDRQLTEVFDDHGHWLKQLPVHDDAQAQKHQGAEGKNVRKSRPRQRTNSCTNEGFSSGSDFSQASRAEPVSECFSSSNGASLSDLNEVEEVREPSYRNDWDSEFEIDAAPQSEQYRQRKAYVSGRRGTNASRGQRLEKGPTEKRQRRRPRSSSRSLRTGIEQSNRRSTQRRRRRRREGALSASSRFKSGKRPDAGQISSSDDVGAQINWSPEGSDLAGKDSESDFEVDATTSTYVRSHREPSKKQGESNVRWKGLLQTDLTQLQRLVPTYTHATVSDPSQATECPLDDSVVGNSSDVLTSSSLSLRLQDLGGASNFPQYMSKEETWLAIRRLSSNCRQKLSEILSGQPAADEAGANTPSVSLEKYLIELTLLLNVSLANLSGESKEGVCTLIESELQLTLVWTREIMTSQTRSLNSRKHCLTVIWYILQMLCIMDQYMPSALKLSKSLFSISEEPIGLCSEVIKAVLTFELSALDEEFKPDPNWVALIIELAKFLDGRAQRDRSEKVDLWVCLEELSRALPWLLENIRPVEVGRKCCFTQAAVSKYIWAVLILVTPHVFPSSASHEQSTALWNFIVKMVEYDCAWLAEDEQFQAKEQQPASSQQAFMFQQQLAERFSIMSILVTYSSGTSGDTVWEILRPLSKLWDKSELLVAGLDAALEMKRRQVSHTFCCSGALDLWLFSLLQLNAGSRNTGTVSANANEQNVFNCKHPSLVLPELPQCLNVPTLSLVSADTSEEGRSAPSVEIVPWLLEALSQFLVQVMKQTTKQVVKNKIMAKLISDAENFAQNLQKLTASASSLISIEVFQSPIESSIPVRLSRQAQYHSTVLLSIGLSLVPLPMNRNFATLQSTTMPAVSEVAKRSLRTMQSLRRPLLSLFPPPLLDTEPLLTQSLLTLLSFGASMRNPDIDVLSELVSVFERLAAKWCNKDRLGTAHLTRDSTLQVHTESLIIALASTIDACQLGFRMVLTFPSVCDKDAVFGLLSRLAVCCSQTLQLACSGLVTAQILRLSLSLVALLLPTSLEPKLQPHTRQALDTSKARQQVDALHETNNSAVGDEFDCDHIFMEALASFDIEAHTRSSQGSKATGDAQSSVAQSFLGAPIPETSPLAVVPIKPFWDTPQRRKSVVEILDTNLRPQLQKLLSIFYEPKTILVASTTKGMMAFQQALTLEDEAIVLRLMAYLIAETCRNQTRSYSWQLMALEQFGTSTTSLWTPNQRNQLGSLLPLRIYILFLVFGEKEAEAAIICNGRRFQQAPLLAAFSVNTPEKNGILYLLHLWVSTIVNIESIRYSAAISSHSKDILEDKVREILCDGGTLHASEQLLPSIGLLEVFLNLVCQIWDTAASRNDRVMATTVRGRLMDAKRGVFASVQQIIERSFARIGQVLDSTTSQSRTNGPTDSLRMLIASSGTNASSSVEENVSKILRESSEGEMRAAGEYIHLLSQVLGCLLRCLDKRHVGSLFRPDIFTQRLLLTFFPAPSRNLSSSVRPGALITTEAARPSLKSPSVRLLGAPTGREAASNLSRDSGSFTSSPRAEQLKKLVGSYHTADIVRYFVKTAPAYHLCGIGWKDSYLRGFMMEMLAPSGPLAIKNYKFRDPPATAARAGLPFLTSLCCGFRCHEDCTLTKEHLRQISRQHLETMALDISKAKPVCYSYDETPTHAQSRRAILHKCVSEVCVDAVGQRSDDRLLPLIWFISSMVQHSPDISTMPVGPALTTAFACFAHPSFQIPGWPEDQEFVDDVASTQRMAIAIELSTLCCYLARTKENIQGKTEFLGVQYACQLMLLKISSIFEQLRRAGGNGQAPGSAPTAQQADQIDRSVRRRALYKEGLMQLLSALDLEFQTSIKDLQSLLLPVIKGNITSARMHAFIEEHECLQSKLLKCASLVKAHSGLSSDILKDLDIY